MNRERVSDASPGLRLSVLWANFGPYHYARLAALNEVFDVTAIQLFDRENARGWQGVTGPAGLKVRTLFPGSVEGSGQRGVVRAVWRALSAAQPQAVLVPGYAGRAALAAAIWAKSNGVPALLMNESTMADRPRRPWVEGCKRQLVRALYDGAVVGGVRSAAYSQALGIGRTRIAYGHNVVDNAFFSDGCERIRRNETGRDSGLDADYFLYVGRLAPEKNLERLLEAFARYRGRGGEWHLVLAGGGPMEADLRAQAERAAISDSVHLAGARPAAELLPYYAWAQCFILPSLSEPWGLVVNEAMAAGLPVIVSERCGCVDDLVEAGANGWVFPPEDVHALTDRLRDMARLPPEARSAMGERSRAIVANYTPGRFANEVSRLLCAEE